MAGREHTLDRGKIHYKWDNSLPPAIEIEPGDVVHCETEEVTDGQIKPGMDASILGNLDFDRLYPLAGPIYVKSAEPGDILEVEILRMQTLDWGWAGIIPGLGLLANDFTTPYIRYFDLTNGQTAPLRDDIHIPIQPFCGTMGVALDEPGPHDVLPTNKGGGNIDTRHRNRVPDAIQPALQRAEGSQPAPVELPVLHRARSDPAEVRRERLLRYYRDRPRFDGGLAERRARHDRLARPRERTGSRGCLHLVQRGRRSADQPDCRRGELVRVLLPGAERVPLELEQRTESKEQRTFTLVLCPLFFVLPGPVPSHPRSAPGR